MKIFNVMASDEGTYTCQVFNDTDAIQEYSFNLTVIVPPHLIVKPDVQSVSEGADAEFTCQANGLPAVNVAWTYNGKPIEEAPPNVRRTVRDDNIIIENVTQSDTGNYGCNASNLFGYIYADLYLNVLNLPPEFTERHEQVVAITGHPVTLPCRYFGVPFPLNKWTRNGEELHGARGRIERYIQQSCGDLLIKSATISDAGEYICQAYNVWGAVETSTFLVFKERTRAARRNRRKHKVYFDQSMNITDSVTELFSSKFDSQEYTDHGDDKMRVECNRNSATFISNARKARKIEYVVKYRTSFDHITKKVTKSTRRNSLIVNGLTPWMNYTFCISKKMNKNVSPTCSEYFCRTSPDVPSRNPVNLKAEGTTPTNLVISWEPMEPFEHNGPDFYYRIYWKFDVKGADWNVANVSDWTIAEYVIEDQPTYVQYRVKVKAANYVGVSRVKETEFYGFSGEGEPSEFPSDFALVDLLGTTSATLRWNPVSDKSMRGQFVGYKIHVWNDVDGKENKREIVIKHHTSQYIITNLRPHAVHHAQVFALNRHYDGPVSKVVTFTTPEGVPGSVETFEAYPLGSAFILRWTKPMYPNGQLTGFNIYYKEIDGDLKERIPQIRDPNINHAKLNGLNPSTKYRLIIAATTATGEGNQYAF